ncbi:MAG TPA: hypothetical protein VGG62_14925 [Terracidiphilus sp.]|jgi:hypothetical protein
MRRRSLEPEWYDLFADWTLADQEAALRILTELHRQAVRASRRAKAPPVVGVNGMIGATGTVVNDGQEVFIEHGK